MNTNTELPLKKKRGRKPKNYNFLLSKQTQPITEEDVNTNEENIIFHLPITINEINNLDNADLDLFIKQEHKELHDDSDNIMLSLNTSSPKINSNNVVHKIQTYNLNFNKNTKCWWCRNSFSTPSVELPEDYYNEIFYCIGNFCSFNCVKSYNLDLNDSFTWKRESLINLLYNKTYSNIKEITPAPSWMVLKEFGGTLSIDDFRQNLLLNTKDYLILHPPLISRQMQIEESYKLHKLTEVPIDKINKIYSEVEVDYSIKRTKPINTKHLNLETTMGLIKNKKKSIKL